MNKNRALAVIVTICLVISPAFTGCKNESAKLTDGVYFAESGEFDDNGWKSTVTLLVEDGAIIDVDWNGANKDGGKDKKRRSADGEYGMVEIGKASAEWYEQAEDAEAYLIEKQDPADIAYSDEEGHTDAITGVSISVNDLFDLAAAALDKGPVGYGTYADGTYHAEGSDFSEEGWKEIIDATVISGYIAAVNWDPVNTDGKYKKELSLAGTYGMVEQGGAKSEWYVQAKLVEDDIVENQDLTLYKTINDNGNIDSVAGISISVIPTIDLLKSVIDLRD